MGEPKNQHQKIKRELSEKFNAEENSTNFINFEKGDTLMKLVERDADGVFSLQVKLKEKVTHDIIKL